jgi:HTH-type transcriptional repressor of NAD biosynthesis genes
MYENLKQKKSDCKRIVLFGPESTGKTTLAKKLAYHFQTSWVPEFAREYLEKKMVQTGEICSYDDLYTIAIEQIKQENKLIKLANKYIFCDTNLVSTQVYSEVYFNKCDDRILTANKKNKYDLYLLTDIDIPWVKDLVRDKPNERKKMFRCFEDKLTAMNISFCTLSGNIQKRLNDAILHIENL